MGIGKILAYSAGGLVLGVGAIAAAPFTGGGSVFGAATLAASLTGAGAVAAGAGLVGVTGGGYLAMDENENTEKLKTEVARGDKALDNFRDIAKGHEEHTALILALSALGIAMANADGKILEIELQELNEFVGGLSAQSYPAHIVKQIKTMISNPPTFNEAMEHLARVDAIKYPEVRNFLVMTMESDDNIHKKEEAFLKAFDIKIAQLDKIANQES